MRVYDTVKPVYNDHLMGYFSAFWVNAIPADALAPKSASASAGIVLAVLDKQYVLLKS